MKKAWNRISKILHNHLTVIFNISVIDSIGKPPADILSGGLIWLGDYEECLSVRASVTVNQTYHSFGGQYCIASVPIDGFQSAMTPVRETEISYG